MAKTPLEKAVEQNDKYWDERAIKRLTDAEKQSEAYMARIHKMYDQAQRNIQRDLENIYANYSKATGLDVQSLKILLTKSETAKLWEELKRQGLDQYVKDNYKARISRLERLQAQVYAKAKELYPQEQRAHTEHYKGVVHESYYKTIYDVQMGTGLDFAFSKIDDNMTTALLNEKWSGKNYSQRIWGNTDILAESLSEIIGGAMISGQSIAKTSRQIRERFDVAKYYADRLVRTETNHFNNEADAMAYEEMEMDQYVFLATLDTHTSTICQETDGEVIPLKEREVGKNFPPLHPNCRSKTRAYMGEEIEKTLKRRAKNPVTGKNEVIGNMSYKDWYNSKVKEHGQAEVDKAYKVAGNMSADKKQYARYVERLGKENVGTFDNFRKIKYNNDGAWADTKYSYRLKRHYDMSISNGDLSPLVGYDLYRDYDKMLHVELNGIETVNGIKVKDHSFHFIDRVFGSVEKKRNGVDIPDIKKTLLNKSARRVVKGDSVKVYGENNIVSINPKTGELIQVNPHKK